MTAAQRSVVRCPDPDPHQPHEYAIRAAGITFAGGLCDPAQWPDDRTTSTIPVSLADGSDTTPPSGKWPSRKDAV